MSRTNNNDCPDLTPNNACNDSCCPDYVPQEDWCKAFNKRTLEQQRKAQQTAIDGMWHNLEDARNTIGQAEQHVAIIYELLLAIQDQLIKVSSHAAATQGDLESVSAKIVVFVEEIDKIAFSAQYNGRRLLGVHPLENNPPPDIVFRFTGCIGFCRTVNISSNDFIYKPPIVGIDYLKLWDVIDHMTDYVEGADLEIDMPIKVVNCAIKDIGVVLDKFRAYRYVLCIREKQIKVCKNGQDICHEHKCKL